MSADCSQPERDGCITQFWRTSVSPGWPTSEKPSSLGAAAPAVSSSSLSVTSMSRGGAGPGHSGGGGAASGAGAAEAAWLPLLTSASLCIRQHAQGERIFGASVGNPLPVPECTLDLLQYRQMLRLLHSSRKGERQQRPLVHTVTQLARFARNSARTLPCIVITTRVDRAASCTALPIG